MPYRPNKISDKKIARIRALRKTGMTLLEIADECEVCGFTVHNYTKDIVISNLGNRTPRGRPDMHKMWHDRWVNGLVTSQLMEKYKCSSSTVTRWTCKSPLNQKIRDRIREYQSEIEVRSA